MPKQTKDSNDRLKRENYEMENWEPYSSGYDWSTAQLSSYGTGELLLFLSPLIVFLVFFVGLFMFNLVIIFAGIELAGLLLFTKGMQLMFRARLMADIPTSTVRSLALGLVEVYGKVEPGEKMFKAPLSGKECVFCRSSGRMSFERSFRFFVRDKTGKVLVDPAGAYVETSPTTKRWVKNGNEYTYSTEWTIKPGDMVYVMGSAIRNTFVTPEAAVRSSANLVLSKDRGDILLISDKKENSLIRRMKRKSVVFLSVGTAIAALGVWLLYVLF